MDRFRSVVLGLSRLCVRVSPGIERMAVSSTKKSSAVGTRRVRARTPAPLLRSHATSRPGMTCLRSFRRCPLHASMALFVLLLVAGCAGPGFTASPPTPTPRPLGTPLVTYHGHTTGVEAVAWSPDSQQVASASDDGILQVWEARTGKLTVTYRGHHGAVTAVAWSPDGRFIASAGNDGTVQLWEATSGTPVFTYQSATKQPIKDVAWSHQGKLIASAEGADVVVWDTATGQMVFRYQGQEPVPIDTLAWSPDDQRIASGTYGQFGRRESTVQTWDATTGAHRVVILHADAIRDLAWSPDGKALAAAVYQENEEGPGASLAIWDATTGKQLTAFPGLLHQVVAWSPEGTRLVSGSGSGPALVRV